MAIPYTLTCVSDVAAAGSDSLLDGLSGRVLAARSRVRIYANRESVDVSYDVTIGKESVAPAGTGAAINTVDGDLPSTRDDLIIETFGFPGDEILIRAANVNAAAQEARVIVMVTEVDDAALLGAMKTLGIA